MTTEEILSTLDAAHRKLNNLAAGGVSGGNLGLRNNSERLYGVAYQTAVRAGIKPQIRKKYRG